MITRFFVVCRCLVVFLGCATGAFVANAADGILWLHHAQRGPITFSANPQGQDARVAFFTARGFTAEAIHPYAQRCGFSVAMKNDGHAAIHTHLADWRAIDATGRQIAFSLPEDWDQEWAKAEVPQPARIAFRWAQFQSENHFAPGDWIMGMVTLASEPLAPFQLIAPYHDDQGVQEIVLDALTCVPD